MSTYVSVDATSPWAIKVAKLNPLGYPSVNLCYACTNGYQTKTVNFDYEQLFNCPIEMGFVPSLSNKSYTYSSSSSLVIAYKTIFHLHNRSRITVIEHLHNRHRECGFPVCSLKQSGCGSSYTGGRLQINSRTGEIKVPTNVVAGYTDTVCIQCTA